MRYARQTGGVVLSCLLITSSTAGSAAYAENARADLRITATARPNPVSGGQPVAFTITIRNAGPADAQEVRVRDTVPGGIADVQAVPGPGTVCELAGPHVTCTRESLKAGESATIAVGGIVDPGTDPGVLTNTATVGAEAPADPRPANNAARTPVRIAPRADLAIGKTMTLAGRRVVFLLLARNHGPADARRAVILDRIPAGLDGVQVYAPPRLSCGIQQAALPGDRPVVACRWPEFRAGAVAKVLIAATRTGPPGKLSNTAEVRSATLDPIPGNNSDTVTRAVPRAY